MRVPLTVLLLAGATGAVGAQTTHVVPNGAPLTSYISAAAPGDILLLGSSHPSFVLNKGLNLRPASGRTTITGYSTALTIPAGQDAVLDRIDFSPALATPPPSGSVISTAGSVAFFDCTMGVAGQSPFVPSCLRHLSGSLALTRCRVVAWGTGFGNPDPLVIEGGACSVVGSRIEGAWALTTLPNPGSPSPAIRLNGGTLTISTSTLLAGDAVYPPFPPVPALLVTNGTAFVTDSFVQGGINPPAMPASWSPAIVVQSGVVHHARCTFVVANGIPVTSGNAVATPSLVGIGASWWFARGATTYITERAGSSGQPMLLVFWPTFEVSILPPVVEPLWGNVATGFVVHTSVPAANATVQVPVVVPNVPALLDRAVSLQALQLDLPDLRASAVVRGLIR